MCQYRMCIIVFIYVVCIPKNEENKQIMITAKIQNVDNKKVIEDFRRIFDCFIDEKEGKKAGKLSFTLTAMWKNMTKDQQNEAMAILPDNVREVVSLFNGKITGFFQKEGQLLK